MKFIKAVLIALPLLAACGGDTTAPVLPPNVTGTWVGSVGSGAGSLTLVHNTAAGTITGNGSIQGTSSAALTVQGTYAGTTVSLTLSSPGFQPINFTGTHNQNSITGTMNGSGFLNTAVTLTKTN